MSGSFVPVRPHRVYEDLAVGEHRRSLPRTVSEDEIVAFARIYDPQWFHSDPELARGSVFGEVVASGIHVLALWRQMDHEVNSDIDFVCGVGWDNLRLQHAVRAGDTIHVTSEITELRPSSKPGRGVMTYLTEVINQRNEVAAQFTSSNLMRKGPL